MSTGERLKEARRRLGLSQRAAAERVGMSYQQLSNLERGRIRNPSLETLSRLATAYGIGVDDLVGHSTKSPSSRIPAGLAELMADAEWGSELTAEWVETLMSIRHRGRGLVSKRDFLEAFLALRRLMA